jgi:hypothetical protein
MSNPWGANNRSLRCLAVLRLLVLTAANAPAMSSTDQVAWRDKPVKAQADWPEGVLDLVNDPLRTEGWHPWFSEWPNDVNHYTFQISGTNDVNHLVTKLAAIKNAKAQVLLYPDKEARGLGFTTVLEEGNGAAVVFSIGSQERINQWYEHLKEAEPGVRVFGVNRFHKPPEAQPPTLTLHAGNQAIDLKALKIPPSVEVKAVVPAADRAEGKNAALVKAIDDFVAKHQTKSAKPAPKQPAPNSK